jgi:hypothetical protein
VTIQPFAQPTLANPVIQVALGFNPSILPGQFVFIDTSGWYQVISTDPSGIDVLTLVAALPGAPVNHPGEIVPPGIVAAGRLVVPSGAPGPKGNTGPQGIQGLTGGIGAPGATGAVGPQGLTGNSPTLSSAQYIDASGATYALTTSFAWVDSGGNGPQITLAVAGTYLILMLVSFQSVGGAASWLAQYELFDANTLAVLSGPWPTSGGGTVSGVPLITRSPLEVFITTAGPGHVIKLYAKETTLVPVSDVTVAFAQVQFVALKIS